MNLEGQVRERNLNPKNACLKRRPELQESLSFDQSQSRASESHEPTVSFSQLFSSNFQSLSLVKLIVLFTVFVLVWMKKSDWSYLQCFPRNSLKIPEKDPLGQKSWPRVLFRIFEEFLPQIQLLPDNCQPLFGNDQQKKLAIIELAITG